MFLTHQMKSFVAITINNNNIKLLIYTVFLTSTKCSTFCTNLLPKTWWKWKIGPCQPIKNSILYELLMEKVSINIVILVVKVCRRSNISLRSKRQYTQNTCWFKIFLLMTMIIHLKLPEKIITASMHQGTRFCWFVMTIISLGLPE